MDRAGGSQGRHCAHWGEALGVYEPIIVVVAGQPAARTSLATALGAQSLQADAMLMHEACHALRLEEHERS
jgi:hypothetical protein